MFYMKTQLPLRQFSLAWTDYPLDIPCHGGVAYISQRHIHWNKPEWTRCKPDQEYPLASQRHATSPGGCVSFIHVIFRNPCGDPHQTPWIEDTGFTCTKCSSIPELLSNLCSCIPPIPSRSSTIFGSVARIGQPLSNPR